MPRTTIAGLCLAATLAPLAAQADQPAPANAQVITVTATRIPTPVNKVAAGVTIITRQEIIARGYTTLAQALSAVPGLGVVQAGGPGTQTSVFIRGTNSEDVLVLQDGVPVNDPSDPNGAFNFGEDLLAGVARIEVIRGPLSGLYGSNAIGGVINIITIQGAGKPQAVVTAAGGYPAQGQGDVTVSGSTGPFDYAIAGAIDQQAGFDATARRLTVYTGNQDPFRNASGVVNLGYTPVPGTRVYLLARARQTDSAYPDLGYPIYDDPNNYAYDTSAMSKFGVKSTLLNGLLTTELFAARLQDDRHYSNLLDGNDPNYASANDYYHGRRTDVQWNNTLHLPEAGPVTAPSLQFGAEYTEDHASESVNESGFVENVDASSHDISGHFGAQATFLDLLTITAAARDDAVSSFGNALTGRVGAVFAIPQADMRLKSSFGTGFLAPSLYDLYGVDNYGYVGNPNLKAEHSTGYDAGAEFDLPFSTTLSVTYFDSNIRDLIQPTPDFTSEENIGRATINGVETELQTSPAPWVSADITYTYTNALNADNHTQLLRRPRNSGTATLTLLPTPRISIVPQIQFIGGFTDYLYADNGYPIGDGPAQPGTIVNLTANYTLSSVFTLFVQCKNLTNSNFEPVNGLQIPGASALFGVRATIR